MLVTIHQPCYLPYLGIFHKIWKADEFVFLDDAQYSNDYVFDRNRIKTPQGECMIKVPSQKNFGCSLLEVVPKYQLGWQEKHLKTISMNYKKAPYYKEFFPLLEVLLSQKYDSLAELNVHTMLFLMEWFNIDKPVHFSSDWKLESRSEDRVIEICKGVGADSYLSGIGGKNYQNEENFIKNGIKLIYQDWKPTEYKQLWGDFIPYMSVIDFAMNEGRDIDSHFREMEARLRDGK